MLRGLSGLLVPLVVALLAGCGGDDAGGAAKDRTITIGSKSSTESSILSELYRQALESEGYNVELNRSLGATENIDRALTDGRIDLYPESTGTMLTVVFDEDSPASAADTYERAKELQEQRGFTLFEMTPFSDSAALAVTAATARDEGLKTIGDLEQSDGFKLGGQRDFETAQHGLVGLRESYGVDNIDFVPLRGMSPLETLDRGTVEVAVISPTDPQLNSGRYVVLEDTEALFGFQNVAPVVNEELVGALGDDFRDTIDAISARLTGTAMIALNAAVAVEQLPVAEVAQAFLQGNDLLGDA